MSSTPTSEPARTPGPEGGPEVRPRTRPGADRTHPEPSDVRPREESSRVVGRVAKAHGVTGEVTVDIHTDEPKLRFATDAVLDAKLRDGTRCALTVVSARPHQERLLVRFAEVVTRDVAEALRGALLLVDVADLPPAEDPDEFYDHELEGLAAELPDGTPVGTLLEVVHGPGGDLLVLELPGGREVLVPFVRAIVPEVDVPAKRVVIDPPEGLLEP